MKRLLSPTEKVIWLAKVSDPPICGVAAHLTGPLTRSNLEAALVRFRQRFPQTAVRLCGTVADLSFTTEDVPPYRVQEVTSDPDHWNQAFQDIFIDDFDTRVGPLFRFHLFHLSEQEKVLAMGFPHVATDGGNSTHLLHALLEILAQPDADFPSQPLTPALEDLLDPALREEVLAYVPTGQEPARETRRDEDVLDPKGQLHVDPYQLSPILTQAFIERCKLQGISVLSALSSAFAHALNAILPEPCERLWVQFPVSQRQVLGLGDLAVGCFFTTQTVPVTVATGNLWSSAQEMRERIKQSCTRQRILKGSVQFIQMAAHTEDPASLAESIVKALESEGFQDDFSLSSLTSLRKPDAYGPYQLKAIYGGYNAQPGERYLSVFHVNGAFCFAMIYREPFLKPTLTKAWWDQFVALLERDLL